MPFLVLNLYWHGGFHTDLIESCVLLQAKQNLRLAGGDGKARLSWPITYTFLQTLHVE